MTLVCPYCRTEVALQQGDGITCEGCGTPHHAECYQENGGCTLFGCKFAPPDDPKVQITTGDVSQTAVFGSQGPVFARPSAFGDVNAPVSYAVVAVEASPPPPPPPPGLDVRADTVVSAAIEPSGTLFGATTRPPKARLTFILLGIFLGAFGAHNFYAGYVKRGLAQLGLTVLTLFYAAIVTWVWALVEVCTVDRDRNDISFA